MRVVLKFILLATALGTAACSSSNNRPLVRPDPAANVPNGNRPFWKDSDNRRAPTASIPNNSPRGANDLRLASNDQADVNGVLAGKLLDPVMNRRPAKAYVLVAPADGSTKPVDFPADENGLFMIPGLVSGRTYVLTARTEEWGRMFVGRTQVAPPQSTLLIRMREDLASADVPPPPAPVGDFLPRSGPKSAIPGNRPPPPPLPDLGTPTGLRPDNDGGWTPGSGTSSAPAPLGPPPGEPSGDSTLDRENIADRTGPKDPAARPAPIISMPGSHIGPGPNLPPLDPPPAGSGRSGSSMIPRPSPMTAFCDISGNRVVNFGMPASDGNFWEFRKRHGKLLLVDFWTSWCGPCKKLIPQLKEWERKYSYDGLEVVSIACDGLGAAEIQAVRNAQQQHGINYRVLLADHNERDPVQQKLRVENYPTLLLIDENGTIIAKANASNFAQLEPIIRQRLRR